jgi:hypothetical protein
MVDRERYMKHVVMNLNDPNEPIMFNHYVLGNYSSDSFFGNYSVEISSYAESNTQSEILHCTRIVEHRCNIPDVNNHDLVQYNIVCRDKLEVFSKYTNHTNLETKEILSPYIILKDILIFGLYFLMGQNLLKVQVLVAY